MKVYIISFYFQVSSINRVLRNLASTSQKNEFNPYMMDNFSLLKSQAWPRPNPWYAQPGMPPLGYNQFPQPAVPSPSVPSAVSPHHEKKGNFKSDFEIESHNKLRKANA